MKVAHGFEHEDEPIRRFTREERQAFRAQSVISYQIRALNLLGAATDESERLDLYELEGQYEPAELLERARIAYVLNTVLMSHTVKVIDSEGSEIDTEELWQQFLDLYGFASNRERRHEEIAHLHKRRDAIAA